MFSSTSRSAKGTAGFTLIEALAALAVAAVSLAAIGALAHTSFRAGLGVERRLALIASARKIVVGMPSRAELANGELSGVVDNHAWRIDASPFPNSLVGSTSGNVWEPQRIALQVRAPSGDVIEIDSIRLRKRAAP